MQDTRRIFLAAAAAIFSIGAAYAAIGGKVAHSDLLCQLLLFFCAAILAVQIIPGVLLGWTLLRVIREKKQGATPPEAQDT